MRDIILREPCEPADVLEPPFEELASCALVLPIEIEDLMLWEYITD